MKKEVLLIPDREKFLRAFQKAVCPIGPFSRFGFSSGFFGKADAEKMILFRAKGGVFSLFALTLYGKFDSGKSESLLTLSFSRSRLLMIPWILWCALVFLAGLSLFSDSIFLALGFLATALLSALPLFLFSKKEKEALLSLLSFENLLSFEKESRQRKL